MVASSSAGFFSSITPSGRPFTNSTTSGRRVCSLSVDGELVDRQPVVGGRIVEVDNSRLRSANRAVVRVVLHRHPLHEHPVKRPVASLQRRTFRADQLAEGVFLGSERQFRIEPLQCVAKTPLQHRLVVGAALGIRPVAADVRPVSDGPPQTFQPSQGRLLD